MRFPTFVRATVCALALLLSAGAFAQGMGGGSISATPKDKSKDKDKPSNGKKGENKYPNATRKEPKLDMSSGDQKDLNKAADLVNENKNDEAEPIVQKIIAQRQVEQVRAGVRASAAGADLLGKRQERRGDRRIQEGRRDERAAERRALPGRLPDRAAADPGREIRRRAGHARPVGKTDRRDDRR